MRILIVAHYTIPHIGGLEIMSFKQAQYLKKLGHEITFITGTLSGCPNDEVIEGIQIRRVAALH